MLLFVVKICEFVAIAVLYHLARYIAQVLAEVSIRKPVVRVDIKYLR